MNGPRDRAPAVGTLTPRMERFCQEYLTDLNASAAYRRAYPSCKSARAAAASSAQLMARPAVAARLAELQRAAFDRAAITAERVLRELALIAFGRSAAMYRPDGTLKAPAEWDEATDAAVAGVETDEAFEAAEPPAEGQEPQAHGGALKRSRAKLHLVRTHKVRRWDKLKALELLCRHLGLLKEDAPHPAAARFDLSKLSDAEKIGLLRALRAARGPG